MRTTIAAAVLIAISLSGCATDKRARSAKDEVRKYEKRVGKITKGMSVAAVFSIIDPENRVNLDEYDDSPLKEFSRWNEKGKFGYRIMLDDGTEAADINITIVIGGDVEAGLAVVKDKKIEIRRSVKRDR